MDYKNISEVYQKLEATTRGLEKTKILAEFLSKLKDKKPFEREAVYLLQGRVFPDYDKRELGLSIQLIIKIISQTTGSSEEEVIMKFKEHGDLGKAAEDLIAEKKQSTLFSKKLTTEKVLQNLQKLQTIEGKGTIPKKISLVIEILHYATPLEARYLIRTILGDLKVGVGSGILRDAIVESCFSPETITEKKAKSELVQEAYDKATDFAEVFEKTCTGKLNEIELSPGKPVKVMLFPKAKDVEDAFRIVGKPAAFEYKYDGFRLMINKSEDGEIKLFTRRLENVTHQFPDVVEAVKKNIKAKSFIVDSEAVGFDPETKKYKPFQYVSQRIRRKYEIEKLTRELPIEINVFDIIFHDGVSLISEPFEKRLRVLKKIVKPEKYRIRFAEQIITDDEKAVENFYNEALEDGQEGLMAKSLQAVYKPGARVGYAVKLKPDARDFDLVITGAEWGTGKRAGWLTSFDVSCQNSEGELIEIGKVSTGLKEKREQGLSFAELTDLLRPLIEKEQAKHVEVKPEVIVTIGYQNIQKSPSYSSGFAMRFPRLISLRPDRGISDIAVLDEVEKEAE